MVRTPKYVESERTVLTYVYTHFAAQEALHHAEASIEGQMYSVMSAMIFCSFTLEAYLNHLGSEKIPFWQHIERRLGPAEKRDLLTELIGAPVDLGVRPFQTFKAIFEFRNALAHGKTARLAQAGIQQLAPGERPSLLEPPWETLCTVETATRFVGDTEQIVRALHRHLDAASDPLDFLSTGGYTLSEPQTS